MVGYFELSPSFRFQKSQLPTLLSLLGKRPEESTWRRILVPLLDYTVVGTKAENRPVNQSICGRNWRKGRVKSPMAENFAEFQN